MRERFVDYFEVGELDPSLSREMNYKKLIKEHGIAVTQRGRRGRTDAELLNEAMEIFKDRVKYDEYRAKWDRRQYRDADPEPEAQPEADNRAQSAETQRESFFSVLGTVALEGLQTYLESKQSREPGQSDQLPPKGQGAGSSLTGLWRDQLGNAFHVQQSGNVIAVKGRDTYGNVVLDGRGILNRNAIQYETRNAAGRVGRGVLKVSRDGTVIEGQIACRQFNMPAEAFQLRLVRS